MSAKRKSMLAPAECAQKKRKAIDLDMKIKIIKEYEAGKKVKEIASELELAHSTISTILKDKDRVKEAVKASTGYQAIITRQRKGLIHEMEKLLVVWIDDQIEKRMPISLLLIQTKARSIFENLKVHKGEESTETFTASHGWFQRFRGRFNLDNRSISGEAASADLEAAKKFVVEFDKIIEKGGYCPEQIFNVVETGLFWKKMPERSYINKEAKTVPGFKAFNDRVTLLLGGNVAGFKLKPLLIYRSQNPHALKQVSKHTLPVYYRANNKAWMTQALFDDWFINCFIPSIKRYCQQKGVPFKIILLLDNAPGHPQHLDDLHPDVKVVYLPKNTTAILQPMDQGAIATFKAYYLHTTFSKAVAATENDEITIHDFWKAYNILHCIKNIASAWEGVTEKCMQGIWKKCLKRFVNNSEGFNETDVEVINQRSVQLANMLDLDVEVTDIKELVEFVEGELSNEDLIELKAQQHLEQEEEGKEETTKEVQKKFTVRGLAGVFSKVNSALLQLESMDPNVERFSKVELQMKELMQCYREIYEEKKKITQQATPTSSIISLSSSPSTTTPDDPAGNSNDDTVNPAGNSNDDTDDPAW